MSEEYEMEEVADLSIKVLRDFIDTEQQLVKKEHELLDKLMSWDNVLGHLDERIPKNMRHLHKLNGEIIDQLIELRELVESGKLQDLKIIKEENWFFRKLDKKVEHRKWRAVKKHITSKKDKLLRLTKKELRELHSGFIDLMKLMKRSSLKSAIDKDLTAVREKEKYGELEDYYFQQIYKFLRAYERIFRHLWRKARTYDKEIEKRTKQID